MMLLIRLVLFAATAAGAAFIFLPFLRTALLPPEVARGLEGGILGDILFNRDAVASYGTGGVLALLAVALLVTSFTSGSPRRRRRPATPPPVEVKPGAKPSKKVARQLMEAKRFKEAAEMFRALGDLAALVDALRGAGNLLEAAEILESDAKHREAAELLESGNQPAMLERAGELWRALNQEKRGMDATRKAAQLHAQKGDGDKAVDLLLRAKDRTSAELYLIPAAEAFARREQHARAGEMFEGFGREAQAGAAFEYHAAHAADDKERRGALARAARNYAKVNDWPAVGRCLEQAGYPDKAAEAYARGQLWQEAARTLSQAGRGEEAARLLIDKGLGQAAVSYLEGQGDMRAAAQAALAAGDAVKAAQLFEDVGDLEGAFNAHVRAANYTAAGDIALQKNRPAEAAELFEKATNYKRAAEIHEGMGNRLKAGELFSRGGDPANAARMLLADGKVREAAGVLLGHGKPESMDVQMDITRKLVMGGDLKGAVQFLKAAVDARQPAEAIPMALELSNLMEGAGDVPNALAYAQRAAQAKKDHAEAVSRVQQLFMRINSEQMRAAYEAAMQQQVAAQSSLAAQRKMVEAQPKDDAPPRYVPEAELGRGAMGVVYRARDTVLNRPVALKRLPEAMASDAEARTRFLAEARAAAGLNHPCIVTVYDAGVERGAPYLAMELVEGPVLTQVVPQKIHPARALVYCAAIASALDAAHKAGIVHRDVKPGNILMGKDGRVKLTDFGIAAALSGGGKDGVTGTPYYMSPEQVMGGDVDGRADIYSLGCVLYALIAGHPPFTGADVLQRHLHSPPPPLSAERPGVPPELDAVMNVCMAKDPAHRFQTGAQAAQAFVELEGRLRNLQIA
ncbi:MAG: protein kinase [Deltaproteobacteria bacterium]|nr:protein kinase [Deltaproteobacteria bacterium]